jgi:hypothetical protein
VVTFYLLPLTLLLSFPAPVATQIQAAFLQSSPAVLRQVLATEGTIPVYLPEPLALADQLSPDQTTLVFRRYFATFRTTEFTIDPLMSSLPGVPGGILRARWSFRNERTGASYSIRLYFFVVPVSPAAPPGVPGPLVASRIVEIRAERR